MLSYTIYSHPTSTEWVTFVHGAGGSSSIWFKQIRFFQKDFNVLLLDLRGHGKSNPKLFKVFNKKYTFPFVAKDVIDLLNHLQIKQSHMVGISLGTIIIRQIAEMEPQIVKSMIMGGAILKLNFQSQILMKLGNVFKYIMPYILLYKLFAFVIMPKKNHKNSRLLFINEAKKLYQKEFIRWFKLTTQVNGLLKIFRQVEIKIPTLYVMGQEDYMFLPSVQKVVEKHFFSSKLVVIPNCGHVVNIEKADFFNEVVKDFIVNWKKI